MIIKLINKSIKKLINKSIKKLINKINYFYLKLIMFHSKMMK